MEEQRKEAKAERTRANMSLTTKIATLTALTETARSVDLDNTWSDIKNAVATVERKQTAYLETLVTPEGDEEGEDVMNPVLEWWSQILTKVKTAENDFKTKRFASAKDHFDTAAALFKAEADIVKGKVKADREVFESAVALMDKAYSDIPPAIRMATNVCPSDKEEDFNKTVSGIKETFLEMKRICATTIAEHEVLKSQEAKLQEKDRLQREADKVAAETALLAGAATAGTGGAGGVPTAAKNTIKFKALENPVFRGDIRSYHRWRDEFTEVMEPRIKESADAEKLMTLKACLSSEVKGEIPSTCSSYADLWKELDREYGKTQKIVSQVLRELSNLNKPGDTEFKNI